MSEIEGWWKKEFQYLLDRKILTRDELGYLFGQIKSIIEQENQTLLSSLKKEKERMKELVGAVDFNTSTMAREIYNGFLADKKIHSQNSIVHSISNDHWIYQIVCAMQIKLKKILEEVKEKE